MKKLPKELFQYIKNINSIKYYSNYIIIESNNHQYLYKDNTPQELIDYLDSIQFNQYYKKINKEINFDLCEIKENYSNKNPIIELYKKSIETKEMDEELSNKIYQLLINKYNYLFQYYMKIQDKIEEELQPSINHYNLLINMTNIYQLLSLGRFFLEEWINQNNKEYKTIIWIGDITKNNILNNKIINISSLKRDYLLFGLANYYNYYYQDNITRLIKNFDLNNHEKCLLYSLIAISNNKIEESPTIFLKYTKITQSYLLEEYKKYQKSKDNMFQEKQENI